MKRFIFIQFAFAALIIGTIAVMMFVLHGAKGMALYLAFAAVCLMLPWWIVRRKSKAEKTETKPSSQIVEWEYMTLTDLASALDFVYKGWWYVGVKSEWDIFTERVECIYTLRRPIVKGGER